VPRHHVWTQLLLVVARLYRLLCLLTADKHDEGASIAKSAACSAHEVDIGNLAPLLEEGAELVCLNVRR